MTTIDIMAERLLLELARRGFGVPHIDECTEILRNVIDHASEVAEKTTEHRKPETTAP